MILILIFLFVLDLYVSALGFSTRVFKHQGEDAFPCACEVEVAIESVGSFRRSARPNNGGPFAPH